MSAAFRNALLALVVGCPCAAQAQTWPMEDLAIVDRPDGAAAGREDAIAYVSAGRSTAFKDASPQFWLAVFDRRTLGHSVMSFHLVQGGSAGSETWMARRRTSRPAVVQTRGATTIDCPALEAVIAGARTLPPPQIALPGPPSESRAPYEDVNLIMDDDGYAFGANAVFAPNDAVGFLQFSGGSNSAVGVWGRAAEDALAPCWRPLDEITLP